MSYCKQCGYEVKWRTIDGKKVPMGCRCDYGEFGLDQFLRDFAAKTTCPKCGDEVYFVRHNGGSVWFNRLGDPWPKHPCFDEPEDDGVLERASKTQKAFPTGPMREPGIGSGAGSPVFILKLDETDLGQRILYVSLENHAVPIMPEPGVWFHEPPPGVGQRVLLDRRKSSIELAPSKAEFRYWPIAVGRCGDCGKLYMNWSGHQEICRGGNA